ncbi:MAG: TetR/AcrR family transcriptional regulator C-terminal domain-containing protein, partial [Arachnia sp.]
HLTAYTIRLREANHLSSERRAKIAAAGEEYLRIVQDILEDGQASGVFSADFDAQLTGVIVVGQLNSMTRWYRPGGRYALEDLSGAYVGMMASTVVSDATVAAEGGIEALRRRMRELSNQGFSADQPQGASA